ncbi:alpha-L-fucosidase [Sunxiuqinia indica]|uniref:alpha-L-fucosidase n=1 Tax=Sunxiuqinia indica TaxID=2692584 RepID=UPI001359CFB0|nr:alpha-L-fucosidase [Sunxiuqinia indica]
MRLILLIVFFSIASFSCKTKKQEESKKIHFEQTWESLSQHESAPEWLKNDKFGIYFHWGVYTVPAFGFEWYPRLMHKKNDKYFGSDIYEHHLDTYGHPSEFGYHDFVPMFKAEKFDPEAWAELFKKAGAKFAGPVAEHSDGFSMWASNITPWNAMDKGPHQDIVGELEKTIRGQGLKFITTFHHAVNLQRYSDKPEETYFRNSYYPYINGMPPTSNDPELKYLYGNIPEQQWLNEVWFPKLKEVIDNYNPDLMWFDSGLDLIPENYRKEFAAYYLNQAEDWGKSVAIVRKQDDLPLSMSINDLEKSRMNRMGKHVWMTDETISTGSWGYTNDLVIKPAEDILHVLIDIVSKNGVLLLNISPKSDGVIPDNQKDVLLKMGDWLGKYGEAIYNTRPWYIFGEGPTLQPEGNFENHSDFKKVKYSAEDVRYTTTKNVIYAVTLGSPEPNKKIVFKAFSPSEVTRELKIKNIAIPGSSQIIEYEMKEDGLWVKTPDVMNEMAVVFKIEIE